MAIFRFIEQKPFIVNHYHKLRQDSIFLYSASRKWSIQRTIVVKVGNDGQLITDNKTISNAVCSIPTHSKNLLSKLKCFRTVDSVWFKFVMNSDLQ